MTPFFRAIGVLFLATSAPPAPTAEVAKPKPKLTLSSPGYLSPELRAVLHRRMERHVEDMQELVFSVLLLRRTDAKNAAARLATEPRLARPLPGDDEQLNSLLPEQFFVLQDELRRRANELSAAAERRDDSQMATAFGRVTQVCVACHASYLEGRLQK